MAGGVIVPINHKLMGPEATAEVFTGVWYRTGDVARLDEDGYLFIVDRT